MPCAAHQKPAHTNTPLNPQTPPTQGRGSGVSFALPTEVLLEAVPNLIVYGSSSGRGVRGATPS